MTAERPAARSAFGSGPPQSGWHRSRRGSTKTLAVKNRSRLPTTSFVTTMLLPALLATATTSAVAAEARLLALTDDGTLVRFTAAAPASIERVAVEGAGATLIGLDVRPQNGRIYALSAANDLYEVDPASGRATTVATLTTAFDGGPLSAFDFNPQSDRLRLIGGNAQNLRVHPDLGAAGVDAAPAYARGDRNFGARPTIAAAAYTNAVAGAPSTKLFDLDSVLDVLVLQDPPNDGVLTTVGPLGFDCEPAAGFDILTEAGVDHAFAASRSTLYGIDLATGHASELGTIGDGTLRIIGLTATSAPRALDGR